MTFATIEQFKEAAEFFPAGRIVPQRILKGPRRYKHKVKFGSDSWALPTPRGYLVAQDAGRCALYIGMGNRFQIYGKSYKLTLDGSPYVPNGGTNFVRKSDDWIDVIRGLL